MQPSDIDDVAALNDQLARDHDIDAYYAASPLPIRVIERQRLAMVRELAAARAGDRIVDVGCGGGHVLGMFEDAELVGVDVSSVMLDKARHNLRGRAVTLLHGELAEVGLADDSFDVAICTEVLEHVIDPRAVLAEIQRVMRPGGVVVVTFPNDELIGRIKGAVTTTGLSRLPPFNDMEWGGDHYHLHVWSRAEMRALLSEFFRVLDDRAVPAEWLPIRCCFRCVAG